MQNWVKEKLKIIDGLYPAERLDKSKSRWRRVWTGQKPVDRYPFVFGPITFNYYEPVFPKEEGLKAYLDEFIFRGEVRDDFIPGFFTGCKQNTIPSMFGAKEIKSGNDYSCERILFSYGDIDKLQEPSMGPGTVAHEWLTMQEYYLQETEGKIPVHVTDTQGPLDVCGQLWGYDNILVAPYEEPEYYNRLMSKVIKAFILFWRKQQELLGDNFIGTHLFAWDWVPEDAGVSLSADSMVMLGPDFFDDHYRVYLEEIGNTFGGLSVHSCGNFSSVMKNLCAIPCLRAVNSSQMTIEQLLHAGFDSKKVIIAFTEISKIEEMFRLVRSNQLNPDISVSGLWPSNKPEAWTKLDWDSIRDAEKRVIEDAQR